MKNKLLRKNLFFLLLLVVFSATAQQKTITGAVTDESNVPLPSVNVIIKGTKTGTQTDFDGNFSINANVGDVLVFSFVGMRSIEKTVGNQTTFNIQMTTDANALDEVIVIGYGTQKKSDVTGAIAQVSAEDLNAFPVQNTLQGIQGKAAGVDISSNSRPGQIGSIRIRGSRSISGGNSPLYVVDGVPLQSGGLEMLNPSDIESIEILKDASATAIYGSRGANGVVLVSTKKGKEGRTQINFDTSVTFENIHNRADYWNAGDFLEYQRDALRYAGLYVDGSGNTIKYADPSLDYQYFGADATAFNNIANGYTFIDRDNLIPEMRSTTAEEQALWGVSQVPVYNGNNIQTTDWVDYVTQTGMMQQYNLSANIGTEKMSGYVSGGYLDQLGSIKGQDYKRYTGLVSLQVQATDWIKLGGTINAIYSVQNYGYAQGGSRGSSQLYGAALSMLPWALPYDEDGEYIFNPGGNPNIINPIRDYDYTINENTTSRMFGSFFAEINLMEGLRFKTIFGPDVANYRNGQFQSAESSLRGGGSSSSTNYARSSKTETISWTLENQVFYDKEFNKNHKIGVTLLQSASRYKTENSSMVASNLPYDSQLWHNLGSTNNGALDGWGSGYSKNTLTSYMARINYNLMDKYLITVTGRSDGASVLSEGNKWDFFPSLALAWKMEEENFLKDNNTIEQLKLRLGYGTVGNAAVGAYGTAGGLIRLPYVFGSTPASGYVTGDPKGTSTGSIPNANLGWEKTQQINLGIDFSLLKSRISGSVDYYIANTNDILLSKSPNSVTGYGSITVNAGKTRNRGFELTLNTVNVETNKFRWTSDLTFTTNQNEIVELVNGKVDDINNLRFIGQPISVYYDYKKIGIWQTEDADEMAVFNANGHDFEAGDIRVEDVNGDGIIDAENDRQILGTSTPKYTGGFTNTFSYGNWDLSMFFFSRWDYIVTGGAVDLQGQYVHRAVDYWTPDNPTNAYPAADYNNGGVPLYYSSMNYQDGSFIKLRNVSLGYNFPKEKLDPYGISNLKVYVQAINPWLYAKTDFMDPDSYFGGNNTSLTTRNLVFGLNLTL
ncbi:TonB-linked outer membrane protein, SusC/RagA family [Pustulibacterium marinum]|uniref:TonB-linked outer membrane protein, SusC/RagA family n=1 Tax=Pustulibacterium marinum TaxID=1224947 RepID=A0A1I7FS99_9FLAO|nr:TonB-dependent receptor [Pustulibacterium marinum]SFU39045.1 TonB-linked outer membrane protein, SusC/RagA family [Pustulibacterium marinum]